jgi:hypothetical protein
VEQAITWDPEEPCQHRIPVGATFCSLCDALLHHASFPAPVQLLLWCSCADRLGNSRLYLGCWDYIDSGHTLNWHPIFVDLCLSVFARKFVASAAAHHGVA